jgi:hypothetical protein
MLLLVPVERAAQEGPEMLHHCYERNDPLYYYYYSMMHLAPDL